MNSLDTEQKPVAAGAALEEPARTDGAGRFEQTKALLSRLLAPAISIALFVAALWIMHQTLAEYAYSDIVTALRQTPGWRIGLALALTVCSYIALTGYDVLAIRYIEQSLPLAKVGFAAAVSYAFSNTIGLSVLTSGSLRYRLYSSWGLSALEIAKIVLFCAITLWVGLLALAGGVLAFAPLQLPAQLHLPFADSRLPGVAMLALAGGYWLLTLLRRRPLQWRDWTLDIPRPGLALLQLLVGALDWLLAGAILYALLPPIGIDFGYFLGVFLLAQTAGLISHVPGGLGVFESIMLLMLPDRAAAADVFGALLAYRLVYYLLPLAVATIGLGVYEGRYHAYRVLWLPRMIGSWIPVLLPQVLALMALVSGAVLLLSGATPAVADRMDWLEGLIPLPLLEVSHFVGSLAGMGLILLARGLQLRLNAAWWLTMLLLLVGIIASLLKGGDYEEAIVLTVLLAGLAPARPVFYRRTSLLNEPFTSGWIVTIVLVLLGVAWLGFFSYKDVQYSNDLWWQFSFSDVGDASRFLRATVGVAALSLWFAVAKLLRPAPPRIHLPDAVELQQAQSVIATCPYTYAWLALLEDKTLLFNADHSAFIMYGVKGRAWVAMGDPVGATADVRRELAWQFRELSERYSGWTVFYQVRPENLDLYLELGLTLLKIGEEARVPLKTFSLEGKSRKNMRGLVNRLTKEDYRFEIIAPEGVAALLPQLQEISDAWLTLKNTREKGFSLGFYHEPYLQRCPLAVARRQETIVAFANVLYGAEREELSVDLMRYRPEAPTGVMDYLFIQLMLWGKAQGYAWFNLGMAPLAGLQSRRLAPLWNRFGALVFGRGERFYNFQGLHQYKDKFDPQWEPRYLAAPGGAALPRILTQLTVLVAGGITGVFKK